MYRANQRVLTRSPAGFSSVEPFFNLYIHDLQPYKSKKFLYSDDMAFVFQHSEFQQLNTTLTEDMLSFVQFCKNSLKQPINRWVGMKLDVMFNGVRLEHDQNPVYLGVKLDRSLTCGKHLNKVQRKLAARNNLSWKLVGTTWGATALVLVYSCVEKYLTALSWGHIWFFTLLLLRINLRKSFFSLIWFWSTSVHQSWKKSCSKRYVALTLI